MITVVGCSLACAVLSLGVAASGAGAQATVKDSERDYSTLVAEALREFEAGHWQEARALFLHAHEIKPSARTLRGIGFTEFELRHYKSADRFLRQSLQDSRNPLTAEQRENVQKALKQVQDFVGRYVIVRVPNSASVSVDGSPAEFESDGALVLEIGEHSLKIAAPGLQERHERIDVRGGEQVTLTYSLEPGSSGDAAALASGRTQATPGSASLQPEPSRKPSGGSGRSHGKNPWPWIVVGVSGAAVISGGILFVLGMNDISKVENAKAGARWSEVRDPYDRAPVRTGAGIALAVVGAAGLTTGIIWLLHDGREKETAGLHVDISPRELQLSGRF